jgi:protein SCO1/2
MLKRVWLVAGLLVVLSLAAIYGYAMASRPYSWHGSVFQPASPAPEIHLNDTQGHPFVLSQAKGKIVLVFFGYTHCPDECPLTMAKLKQVISELGPAADRVEVVFVTIDPQRDTPGVLQAYLAKFNPSFIGLTGPLSALEPVWQAYGVYQQTNGVTAQDAYQVTHSTQLYVIDQNGRLRFTYSIDSTAAEIEQDLRQLIKSG